MSLKIPNGDAMLSILTLQISPMARPRKPTIELPPHVNVVRAKGRPYYYFHHGHGTTSGRNIHGYRHPVIGAMQPWASSAGLNPRPN